VEDDPIEGIRLAVDWYVDVVGERSYAPYRRVADPGAVAQPIAAIDAAIAPLVLPAEIRWLWEHWDAPAFDVVPPAGLSDPAFALDSWTVNTTELGFPRALFPIGYSSHRYLALDLTDPPGAPATAWAYEFGRSGFERVAPSLEALVRSCVERVHAAHLDGELPDPEDLDLEWYYQRLFHGPAFDAILDRHFAAAATDRCSLPGDDPARWPAAWRAVESGSHPA